jgi:hypothetical protein
MYNKVKTLVDKARNKMMMSDRGATQESIIIYNELVEAGYIKKVNYDIRNMCFIMLHMLTFFFFFSIAD